MKEANKPELLAAEQARALQQRAEEELWTTRSEVQGMSPEEVQRLVHELQVHQIELRMQNEELQHAQLELTAARDRYQDLYDFAPVGYVTLSPEGAIREANLTVATMLGTERGRLVGSLLSRFIRADGRDTFLEHLRRLRAEQGLCVCQVAVQRSAGPPMILKLESVVVGEKNGMPRLFRMVLSDVSAQAQAEEALRRSEERFRALIEYSADVFMILGPEGTIHYQNQTRAARELHGYGMEEQSGKNTFDAVHPEDRSRMQALLADTAQRPGRSPLTHVRVRNYDGAWRTVEAIFNNQLTNPAIAGITYTGHDITEQQQAEEALRLLNETLEKRVVERTRTLQESEERYRDLFENASDMIITMTLDGVVTAVSRSVEQSLGYSLAEMLGKNWREFTTPDSIARFEERRSHLLGEEADPPMHEFETIHKAGRTILFEGRIRYIRDAVGHPVALHGIYRDITQRKEVDRLKTELIATVSHELRTPLTSLRGYSELLLTRDFPPQQQRNMVSIIHQESTRLTALINDFLDLQRMDAGRQPYAFEPVALKPLLREAIGVFSGDPEKHPFEFAVQAPLPLVRADPNRLRQVMSNLLSNAIKYSPAGGQVSVGARGKGEEVVVWITDRGIGIPLEPRPYLFSRFFRVNNAATREIGGTGLGLALVREIITAHRGRVWVESTEGKGSTFFFAIPVAQAE